MLTPLFEARRTVDRMNEKRISCGTDDKHSSVQQIHVKTEIAIIVRKFTPIHLVLVGLMVGHKAVRLADENLVV